MARRNGRLCSLWRNRCCIRRIFPGLHRCGAGGHRRGNRQGGSSGNLCNRGRSGQGVQLELSRGLRSSLFLDHNSEHSLVPTPRLQRFAAAVQRGLQAIAPLPFSAAAASQQAAAPARRPG